MAELNVLWPRGTCWLVGFLHDLWVSRCFSVVWALVFKLPSPFISPFTFPNFLIHCSKSLLLCLFLQLFQLCFGDFPFPIYAALFSRYVSLFPFLFLFLGNLLYFSDFSPFPPPFFLVAVIVFVLWFLGFSCLPHSFSVFSGCPWLVVLRLG